MNPQVYRQVIYGLLKIAKVMKDPILEALIIKYDVDSMGTGASMKDRAIHLMKLTIKVIEMGEA